MAQQVSSFTHKQTMSQLIGYAVVLKEENRKYKSGKEMKLCNGWKGWKEEEKEEVRMAQHQIQTVFSSSPRCCIFSEKMWIINKVTCLYTCKPGIAYIYIYTFLTTINSHFYFFKVNMSLYTKLRKKNIPHLF